MRFILAIVLLQFGNPAFSQAGWYLKVDGVLWNSSSTVPNNAKLIFGLKEGTNMTPCYNLTTAKLKHNGVVLAQPTGLKNPWNINLATILNGKTGMISIEIGGKGCTNSNTQSWVINVNTTASVPAGTTAATSMLKNMPRTQHVVAKIVFANTSAVVNSICFVTGYPKSNNYQTVSNAKVNTGVLKSVPTGYNYLEYKFNNVAKGAQAVAIYEFDITTYNIEMNLTNAKTKAYNTTTSDYINFTRSVPSYTNLTNAKLKTICDQIWSQCGNDYMKYAKKVAEWMQTNTEWIFTGGVIPSDTFFNSFTAGTKRKGDCGSLSNAMIAMLRYKGIPARMLIGYGTQKMTSTDAKFHAWLEFYIQDFGWIPVDPSYRVSGKVELGKVPHKGIIISKDAFYTINMLGSNYNNMFIQSYLWALSGVAPSGSYTLNFTAVSSNFSE